MGVVVYIEPDGEPVPPNELRDARARSFAGLLSRRDLSPFATLVECRRLGGDSYVETVVLDVDVERPQYPVHPIQQMERIAAVFREGGRDAPETLALRSDFPWVPHLNPRTQEIPRSLCLTDQPFPEARLRWTAAGFLKTLRSWLALTATGMLHQPDQSLEPLIARPGIRVILPSDLFADGKDHESLYWNVLSADPRGDRDYVVIAGRERLGGEREQAIAAIRIALPAPITHGVIRRLPRTVKDLAELLTEAGHDLLEDLRARMKDWGPGAMFLQVPPLFIVDLPRRRSPDGPVENVEPYAFWTPRSICEVGEGIGVFAKADGRWGLLHPPERSKQGEDIPIETMLPYYRLSRDDAAAYSGISPRFRGHVVGIGLGALGSQIFSNLVRGGFGEWTCVDSDILLPHNLVRHQLSGGWVGLPKAHAIVIEANRTVDGQPIATALVADVLAPESQAVNLEAALESADLIVDTSASVAVARHLALDHARASARRISTFFNPAGTDLVVLSEDAARQYRLDALEMQYYRAVASDPRLSGHLQAAPDRRRYGRSCRDITTLLPQDQVALHAAIGSRAIRMLQVKPEAAIRIWRSKVPDLTLDLIDVTPAPVIIARIGSWIVCTDQAFLENVRRLREDHLPVETGGVLIGSHDMDRRIVYVVDLVPSPPDSIEATSAYIRGCEGLREAVVRIETSTFQNLCYVGEWHSHPPGCGSGASEADRKLFHWIARELEPESLPAVMLIVGEASHRWCVEELPDAVPESIQPLKDPAS